MYIMAFQVPKKCANRWLPGTRKLLLIFIVDVDRDHDADSSSFKLLVLPGFVPLPHVVSAAGKKTTRVIPTPVNNMQNRTDCYTHCCSI